MQNALREWVYAVTLSVADDRNGSEQVIRIRHQASDFYHQIVRAGTALLLLKEPKARALG